MDINVPSLEKLTVFGVLEIPDTMNETSNSTSDSSLHYRRVILKATYIFIQVNDVHSSALSLNLRLLSEPQFSFTISFSRSTDGTTLRFPYAHS